MCKQAAELTGNELLLACSVNMSIGRYWEGRTAMETARIRWADACMCVACCIICRLHTLLADSSIVLFAGS